MSDCALCTMPGGTVLFASPAYRVVAADDTPLHPAFCRVILTRHVREMTDLDTPTRAALMNAVLATESALRALFPECKINLASLGNVVPHLHWHVIARFRDDPHFPAPIWANALHARPPALPADWHSTMRTLLAQYLGEPADAARAFDPVASPLTGV